MATRTSTPGRRHARLPASSLCVALLAVFLAICTLNLVQKSEHGSTGCLMTYMRPAYTTVPAVQHARGYTLQLYEENSMSAARGALGSPTR